MANDAAELSQLSTEAAAPAAAQVAAPPTPPSFICPGVPVTLRRSEHKGPADGCSGPDAEMRAAARQPHSWVPCPGSAFQVRSGPNYRSTGSKAPSAPCLYEVFAVDAYTSERKLPHIGRVVQLPEVIEPPPPDCGLPPYVLINWMVPNYAPHSMLAFGSPKRVDGARSGIAMGLLNDYNGIAMGLRWDCNGIAM